jgi:hypothetical protein
LLRDDPEFEYTDHSRRVCYFIVTIVVVLAGITLIAWGERTEANFATMRASSFWALYNARSLQDVEARLNYKKVTPGNVQLPTAPWATAAPTPSVDANRQTRELLTMERDRNDALTLATHYEAVAQREQADAQRFGAAQMMLMIAICFCALAAPTRRMTWCYVGLITTVAAMGVAGYSFMY